MRKKATSLEWRSSRAVFASSARPALIGALVVGTDDWSGGNRKSGMTKTTYQRAEHGLTVTLPCRRVELE